MRKWIVATATCLALTIAWAVDAAEVIARQPTNVAAQNLEHAVQTLATQWGCQVVYRSELVNGLWTDGATGNLTFDEALMQLLVGSGLTYRYLGDRAVTLVPIPGTVGNN